jgi:hypothetical protein
LNHFQSGKKSPAWDAACNTYNLTDNISTVCRKGGARHVQEGENGVSREKERIPRTKIQAQRGHYHMSAMEELFPTVVAVSPFITF